MRADKLNGALWTFFVMFGIASFLAFSFIIFLFLNAAYFKIPFWGVISILAIAASILIFVFYKFRQQVQRGEISFFGWWREEYYLHFGASHQHLGKITPIPFCGIQSRIDYASAWLMYEMNEWAFYYEDHSWLSSALYRFARGVNQNPLATHYYDHNGRRKLILIED